ncbi:2-oxoacid:acceptor oxidoreductase subunit alpha [Paludibaculum fermentans]|uniref:2-oxoacid:acceptor oxidoreductase subunit alpha n=1 Tax=Paludibaculum fermentans TaxID=1473598 RepID=A0A7S7NMS9_PALFE|nr:2-oxoacid:acceptor oxidoreductase subunit alpha [Paludibaculum fermentans]QOY86480.1 2-oxoacid:acceptor oxidoreductase subunit alpha [Paludibaculum fermentans]
MHASPVAPSMSAEQSGPLPSEQRVVNDFSIQVGTVNGSGSQTANNVLMRSIFQMGVPVSGKNLFPSNIAGLPTWFTIRASKQGYIGRKKEIDFLVAMNPETAREDVMSLAPGTAAVYDAPLNLNELRDDIHFYPVPFDKLVAPVCPEAKLRKLVRNMIYDGVVAHLLGIDLEEMRKALYKQFGEKKKKAAELNWGAVLAGRDYAEKNLVKTDPYWVEPMDKTAGKLILDGNTAAALGCLFAGVTVLTWYPITPSSSLAEALISYLGRFRHDEETKKATYAVVQAEDELASIGMAIGAGWAGARSMTCTSGPGVSLMSEFIGLAYFAEIPVVVVDVQRVGPSTGLPTRTMQGDILNNALLSHGDTHHPVLFPSSPEECFTMAQEAFDLAEQFQTPVFMNMDLDLGMNNWMSEAFPYPEKPLVRGKVLDAEALRQLGGFARYKDVDGDGIPYRTLPGTNHAAAAYFTRGTGHNEKAGYSEREDDWIHNMDRLNRKFENMRTQVPAPDVHYMEGARVGLVCCGTSRYAVRESRDQLSRERGMNPSWLRLRAYPFSKELEEFIDRHERVYVVDQNRDAQLLMLMRMEMTPERIGKLRSVRYYGGLPLDARTVTDEIVRQEGL